MKTPNLFDVPRDRPTAKERLREFKERHGIWTFNTPGLDYSWLALLVPKAREMLSGYGDMSNLSPIELFGGYCRLLDEAHLTTDGKTERDAIEELCRLNKIPFKP